MSSLRTHHILEEVGRERDSQDHKWGPPKTSQPSFDPALQGCTALRMASRYNIPGEAAAKYTCDKKRHEGACTLADVLVEEVAEVVGTCNDLSEKTTRAELVQVAAVAVKWIEIIDARHAPGRLVGVGQKRGSL